MKNKKFKDSIICAVQGLIYGFKTERNFLRYVVIALSFLVINFLCGASAVTHIIFLSVCGGVFSAELINTAIEHLSNRETTEFDDEIKIIKDIAAAGVLVWGFVFFAMEAIIIVGYFL